MSTSKSHVVVVGAGQAGAGVAMALRNNGFDGAITLIGDEAHPPYERPPLSKDVLQGRTAVEKTWIQPISAFNEKEIEVRLDIRVTAIDAERRALTLSDRSQISYDKLVLATGARPRMLTLPGTNNERIHVLRTIDDALRLSEQMRTAKSIAVVGGGFIGLEVAASARAMGVAVTVLEAAPRLMERSLPESVATFLADVHKENGVAIVTHARLRGFEQSEGGVRVLLDADEFLDVDCVVMGVGAIPNTEIAEGCGLVVQDGIVVDEYGRTSHPDIYAAGDVTRHFNPLLDRHIRLESWQNAQNQAIAVAKAIAGEPEAYAEVAWLWSDQYHLNIQTAGNPGDWNDFVWRGKPEDGKFTVLALADRRIIGAICINNGRDMRYARQMITNRVIVDREKLADPATTLQSLSR
ncbi:NAD(P)/FAD-dependent oxidoreductase [Paraburkholderia tuberum]|uniref:3-phenylpropionate/trans-cinnamate dioxygenase ferredoxin reductase subunit n=1 Tax=Paraburkholderia tuberum TaxID=157910 RepID=A0A1H1KGU0_9BURK|nr:FAD-dependent oxidoreductase [Paraburkholderia tuberum]SDR61541.1 3-phenylpropionate/trans-cinnamate dioxygenase ferredoxin reductase subunit [Paraburkholderia tuberum]